MSFCGTIHSRKLLILREELVLNTYIVISYSLSSFEIIIEVSGITQLKTGYFSHNLL